MPSVNRKVLRAMVMLAAAMGFLASCTREWNLSVIGFEGDRPIFCVSQEPDCQGDGAEFSSLEVSRVDSRGDAVETVWAIQGVSNRPEDYVIKRLTYGTLPNGWREVVAARPLEANVYYGVRGERYFIIDERRHVTILSREAFHNRIQAR